jgi:hypothetical protein
MAPDDEALVKAWALQTSVAALLTRADGGVSIYNAMPKAAPVPSLICWRTGGGPRARKDLPEHRARMQMHCWGTSRAQASLIARTLVSELDSLARLGGFDHGDARLAAAEVINLIWLPDPESDTARYIVDALVTTVST